MTDANAAPVSRRAFLATAAAGLTALLWVAFSPGAVLEPVRRVQPVPLAVGLAALAALVWLVGRCWGAAPTAAGPDALERGAATF